MIILASASPRRKQLMESITSDFKIEISHIDESKSFDTYHTIEEIVSDIALRKCLDIAENHVDDIVIAADTVVVIEKEIIGKPKDYDDAYHLLRRLSNNHHDVYTAYAIKKQNQLVQNIVKSSVVFHQLSDQLIKDYIATGSPMDKAGAYGIQDNARFPLVKQIIGSINNVIGFPIEQIKDDLENVFHVEGLK